MKILHVVNDANTGGAQTLIEQLALEQRSALDTHILVLLGPGSLSERFARCASSVTYLSLDRRSVRIDRLVRETRRVIRTIAPDVVHSHLLQADLAVAIASRGMSVATVSTIHTTGMSKADPLRSRILSRVLGKLSSVWTMRSIACGDGAAKYMVDRGYAPSRSTTINNGVKVPVFSARASATGQRELLSLSRWHPMKDHDNLFRAFRIVLAQDRSSLLTCAGTGMHEGNLELMSLLDLHGIKEAVRLVGPVSDVRSLIRDADALVISSRYGEALPMAGLESIAEGTPVVTTRVGDCVKLVADARQCVPPQDAQALAGAIEFVLSSPHGSYEELCRASHEIALREFSIQSTAAAYSNLYRELATGTSGVRNAA